MEILTDWKIWDKVKTIDELLYQSLVKNCGKEEQNGNICYKGTSRGIR